MSDKNGLISPFVVLFFCLVIVSALMWFAPATGRIMYPLNGDPVDHQRVDVSGTYSGVRDGGYLTVCVVAPNNQGGPKPCWPATKRDRGVFETKTATYVGTNLQTTSDPYPIELWLTSKEFSDSEQMTVQNKGRRLDRIDITRTPDKELIEAEQRAAKR
jgi:hypothetical protein